MCIVSRTPKRLKGTFPADTDFCYILLPSPQEQEEAEDEEEEEAGSRFRSLGSEDKGTKKERKAAPESGIQQPQSEHPTLSMSAVPVPKSLK